MMPACYAIDVFSDIVFSDISHEALDAISGLEAGSLEAPAQLVEEPESMERQSLFSESL